MTVSTLILILLLTAKARAAGKAAVQERARNRALDLVPTIQELRAGDRESLRAIAGGIGGARHSLRRGAASGPLSRWRACWRRPAPLSTQAPSWREAASAVENGLNACRGQPEFSQPKETAEPYLGAIAAASSEFVVSGNSVIGTRIQRCLVASPGPPMSPHHDGWVGALTVCDVASKRPHLIQSLLRGSVAARSGNDKHSCNAGGPRRCWTEPAKTHQQRSRCVGQQAWKRNGLTLITPARGSSQEQTVFLRFGWPPQAVNRSLHNI
jgi:hypothetical protein